jgi:hypothetical protein
MWTDFNGSDLRAMETAGSQMNDYRLIYNPDKTLFTPADSIALHKNFASKLLNWLGKDLMRNIFQNTRVYQYSYRHGPIDRGPTVLGVDSGPGLSHPYLTGQSRSNFPPTD